jgi:DNA-binding NarL/FixJ family response regulator
VRIAVIAANESDRSAISAAFTGQSGHRVVCSAPLDMAPEALARRRVDALIGFVENAAEWTAFRALAERLPDVLTVLLVSDPDRIDAHADGSILNAVLQVSKERLAVQVADAVAAVTAGKLPGIPIVKANDDEARRLAALTEREQEVLQLTAQGLSIKEIARELHRGYGTIATHRVSIMEKLDLHDRVALARFAIRTGLIQA